MSRRGWGWAVLCVAVCAVAATALLVMGRLPWCACGKIKLWHGVVWSSENSQHPFDFYTFSHIPHGFAFYAITWLLARRWPLGARSLLATLAEAAWEVFENTDFVITRYREKTMAFDYYGDSVINSMGDIAATLVGFWLAASLPVRAIVVLTILLELALAALIRDNLTLNLLMLIWPHEGIRQWQMGGA
jgi:hypothetical protein